MSEEWQQHNYNTVNTHKTVIELASHIKITSKTSNVTSPKRKIWRWIETHRNAALGSTTEDAATRRDPTPSKVHNGKHGRTYQHPVHRQGNFRAQGHSNPSHIIAQPRRTRNNENRTSHREHTPTKASVFYIPFIVGRCLYNYFVFPGLGMPYFIIFHLF